MAIAVPQEVVGKERRAGRDVGACLASPLPASLAAGVACGGQIGVEAFGG